MYCFCRKYSERKTKSLQFPYRLANHLNISEAEIKDKYIHDEVNVGVIATDANVKDLPQQKVGDRILSLAPKNTEVKNGTIYFDIMFTVSLPDQVEELTHIYINLEMQLTNDLGYPIPSRAIYYLRRMISGQKGVEFQKSEYGKIKKCYSIWLCPDKKGENGNYITKISFANEDLYGEANLQKESYDKTEAIICSFGENSDHYLLRFLEFLFPSSNDFSRRKEVLEKEYSIPLTGEMEGELSNMCNLSDGIWLDGIEKGREEGIERGIEEGTERGIEEGTERGIEEGTERGIEEGTERGIEEGTERGIEEGTERGIEEGTERGIEEGTERGIVLGVVTIPKKNGANVSQIREKNHR